MERRRPAGPSVGEARPEPTPIPPATSIREHAATLGGLFPAPIRRYPRRVLPVAHDIIRSAGTARVFTGRYAGRCTHPHHIISHHAKAHGDYRVGGEPLD